MGVFDSCRKKGKDNKNKLSTNPNPNANIIADKKIKIDAATNNEIDFSTIASSGAPVPNNETDNSKDKSDNSISNKAQNPRTETWNNAKIDSLSEVWAQINKITLEYAHQNTPKEGDHSETPLSGNTSSD